MKTTLIMKKAFSLFCVLSSCLVSIQAAPGDLDPTFGGGSGALVQQFNDSQYAGANSVFVRPTNGKIIVAGGSQCATAVTCFAVARYLPSGTPDASFHSDGLARVSIFNGTNYGHAVTSQPDASIIVAGRTNASGGQTTFGIVKFLSTGALDNSFSDDGLQTINFGSPYNSIAKAVAIQPDGKIIVAGDLYDPVGDSFDFAVVRLLPNGLRDFDFDFDGRVTLNMGSGFTNDGANSIILQPDGKIIVAGSVSDASNIGYGMVRFNSNGSLDSTFGNGGKVVDIPSPESVTINSIALQGDGKIVSVGNINNGRQDGIILRFNANGSLDSTFNAIGAALFPQIGSSTAGNAIAITQQGNIVVTGYEILSTSYTRFLTACYTSSGSLNTQFGYPLGYRELYFNQNLYNEASGISLQSDGKVVVAGTTATSSDQKMAVARYLMNGL